MQVREPEPDAPPKPQALVPAGPACQGAPASPTAIPVAPAGARESYLRIQTTQTAMRVGGRASRIASPDTAPGTTAGRSGLPEQPASVARAGVPVSASESAAVARRRLSLQEQLRIRRPPTLSEQARRRRLLSWTKWSLPAAALLLLGSIAAWPELNRAINAGQANAKLAAAMIIDNGRMLGAHYRGLDAQGRPFMITADEARDIGQDRVELTHPVADSVGQGGSWILVRAKAGVYMPHAQILDLSQGVILYRDDGTLMNGPTAVVDVRRGIVASDDWVHAEGPFGVLDAQGDLLAQHDGVLQFRGPARMILNDDRGTAAR